ncbi:MAG: hypothetical protein M3Y39_03680 [Chloroflexota bacterium]|nr:hypothetical protein [Chloroflexota bacterium]
MGKRKNETSTVDQQQPYDNILKSLLEGQEAQILPYLLDEEVVYLDTLTIEVMIINRIMQHWHGNCVGWELYCGARISSR